jgi:hypothetical protein
LLSFSVPISGGGTTTNRPKRGTPFFRGRARLVERRYATRRPAKEDPGGDHAAHGSYPSPSAIGSAGSVSSSTRCPSSRSNHWTMRRRTSQFGVADDATGARARLPHGCRPVAAWLPPGRPSGQSRRWPAGGGSLLKGTRSGRGAGVLPGDSTRNRESLPCAHTAWEGMARSSLVLRKALIAAQPAAKA